MKKTIFILFILITSIVLTSCSSNQPGNYDQFAQCLTEKGAKMYGTEWCSHCKNQKKTFGNSFQYIDYIDCDDRKQECLTAGVSGYPTWVVDGNNYPGEQSLYRLASLSGCKLDQDIS